MRYLPIHIDLKGVKIVVFGGQGAAEAKLRTLLKTEGNLHVIAQNVGDEIRRWAEQGQFTLYERAWVSSDFDDVRLIYAATEDDAENAKIAAIARQKGILVNAADQKEACDFITPAIVDRSPVVVSIGTEGTSPSLARAFKTDLEARLPARLGELARKTQQLRHFVSSKITNLAERQRFWADIFGTRNLDSQVQMDPVQLAKQVHTKLDVQATSLTSHAAQTGKVSLVGAGPGNPDLLTLAARQRLHSADVIVYDRLVSQGVLDFGRREAEYIYVGKDPHGSSTPQDNINEILVEKAGQGLSIVRLKSGDPLIFGRADEELDALVAAGIDWEIIPGITAAASAAAEIGASLTTRGHNKAVALLTGHDAKGFAEQDWKSFSKDEARAAVYMGVGAARFIQGRLLLHGARRDRPVTIVENASRDNQIIVSTTLEHMAYDIELKGIKGPAVLLIGYAERSANELAPRLKEATL